MKLKAILYKATLLATVAMPIMAYAQTPITFLPTTNGLPQAEPIALLSKQIAQQFSLEDFRAIKAQLITTKSGIPDHVIVYLLSKNFHRVDVARMDLDRGYHVSGVHQPYHLSAEDNAQQPGGPLHEARCPDNEIAVIAFAPNDMELEQRITEEVAQSAEAHGLKTVRLLLKDATRKNYLDYMQCPKLVGNFYDGDANPEVITTVDGVLTVDDIQETLNNQFHYKVTNYWLACEAYNDPMQSTMLYTAQSQKYAAGINDLLVGPSDETAACAMKAAFDRQPLTASFQDCYNKYDDREDQWGYGGDGADIFAA